ncbi:hypothetical protein FCK90_11615 [Kocuria coralli]|uniref:Uncharacterized protein n=1 Tax=Kocuria coralli TaxID=1461025 RepID=A0A5J5KW83_9MICC|nr:hypothetical protein [Kocuria coralli]KAA9393530.1 hypothetical protein FCK90_11615 [Kocuria coralli]
MDKHNLFDDGSEESDLLGGEAVPAREGEAPGGAPETMGNAPAQHHDPDPLQGFQRMDAEHAPTSSVTWSSVAVAVAGLLLAVLLVAFSYSSFQRADQLRGWANDTWVVTGQYSNMTNALEGTEYNPVYQIALPEDPVIGAQRFDSGMSDPLVPRPGQAVEIRGSATGEVTDDFDQRADVVLGIEDGTLQVFATEDEGSLSGGVTDQSVSRQVLKGWLLAGSGVVALGLGIGGAIWLRRRGPAALKG